MNGPATAMRRSTRRSRIARLSGRLYRLSALLFLLILLATPLNCSAITLIHSQPHLTVSHPVCAECCHHASTPTQLACCEASNGSLPDAVTLASPHVAVELTAFPLSSLDLHKTFFSASTPATLKAFSPPRLLALRI
ncbi:hypothetical protein FTO74_12255 [Granulicella sp. WH15]|uniref:hypothetical protein n=1 Tax=Granulicella sp. WH15 TaxID=2602070 RepID=UPI001367074F|nr:hypothetical protein [Granulicella sp. WH15]QHN04058.1 hypothetical protein FTO74_12255 [Granulicella sp. WH15]